MSDEARSLDSIGQDILNCEECPLHSTRNRAVPGEGPSSAWIMLVGEAPGAREDREGRPFVGSAGKFLDRLLEAAELDRDSVFVTNVVKCRPPSNRDPRKGEISVCLKHLEAQMDFLRPRLVCILGRVALNSLLGKKTIGKWRGKPQIRKGVVYFPTIHPAACLYDPSKREVLMEDFHFMGRLAKGGPEELESRIAAEKGMKTIDSFS